MEELGHKNFSYETRKKVWWVLKMYRDWRNFRESQPSLQNIYCDLDNQDTITKESLNWAMCKFITEVKKLDGSDFPGKTLYDIVMCMQFHLETLGFAWRLLCHEDFKEIKFTLNNMMKKRTADGIGISVKKAQILSVMDEELLWSLNLLGVKTPDMLLNSDFSCWEGVCIAYRKRAQSSSKSTI